MFSIHKSWILLTKEDRDVRHRLKKRSTSRKKHQKTSEKRKLKQQLQKGVAGPSNLANPQMADNSLDLDAGWRRSIKRVKLKI